VARSALAAERPGPPRGIDLLLDGLALRIIDGYATGVPVLRRALKAFEGDEVTVAEGLGWGWLACYIASVLFEHDLQYALAERQVRHARDAGALVVLPNTLAQLAGIHLRNGRLSTAAGMIREMEACVDATGGDATIHLRLSLAAVQGREDEVKRLIEARPGLQDAGLGGHVVNWGCAVLYNGLGRYEEAMGAAIRGASEAIEPVVTPRWALPELVEAGVRSGARDVAEDALRWFCEVTQVSGTDWALGLEERSRALLSEGEEAEQHYRAAIEYLDGAGNDVELGRAHLIYGEWLRRERRRVDARESLRTAHELLSGMGIQAFADRAARELLATGETARSRRAESSGRLTAQEEQIARLARDGLSNPEIGERLFISPRTVEYHLHKVFAKLGIRSRSQLERALARDDADTVQPV
jgi:DNA-binding CsgD family transcriptional regulator